MDDQDFLPGNVFTGHPVANQVDVPDDNDASNGYTPHDFHRQVMGAEADNPHPYTTGQMAGWDNNFEQAFRAEVASFQSDLGAADDIADFPAGPVGMEPPGHFDNAFCYADLDIEYDAAIAAGDDDVEPSAVGYFTKAPEAVPVAENGRELSPISRFMASMVDFDHDPTTVSNAPGHMADETPRPLESNHDAGVQLSNVQPDTHQSLAGPQAAMTTTSEAVGTIQEVAGQTAATSAKAGKAAMTSQGNAIAIDDEYDGIFIVGDNGEVTVFDALTWNQSASATPTAFAQSSLVAGGELGSLDFDDWRQYYDSSTAQQLLHNTTPLAQQPTGTTYQNTTPGVLNNPFALALPAGHQHNALYSAPPPNPYTVPSPQLAGYSQLPGNRTSQSRSLGQGRLLARPSQFNPFNPNYQVAQNAQLVPNHQLGQNSHFVPGPQFGQDALFTQNFQDFQNFQPSLLSAPQSPSLFQNLQANQNSGFVPGPHFGQITQLDQHLSSQQPASAQYPRIPGYLDLGQGHLSAQDLQSGQSSYSAQNFQPVLNQQSAHLHRISATVAPHLVSSGNSGPRAVGPSSSPSEHISRRRTYGRTATGRAHTASHRYNPYPVPARRATPAEPEPSPELPEVPAHLILGSSPDLPAVPPHLILGSSPEPLPDNPFKNIGCAVRQGTSSLNGRPRPGAPPTKRRKTSATSSQQQPETDSQAESEQNVTPRSPTSQEPVGGVPADAGTQPKSTSRRGRRGGRGSQN
ncbi:hypothetical protein BR93DRAFT_332588 [Coniochaeta sp. PMI_546]|nr:hypothetical protein BR93DRAFT_332588 [Coniochaeta sp. PMI_546]